MRLPSNLTKDKRLKRGHLHLTTWDEYVFSQPARLPLTRSGDAVGYSNEPNNVGMTEVKNLVPL